MVANADLYKAYYTTSQPIIDYMLAQLDLQSGMRVFEPCAGEGAFIEALIATQIHMDIEAYELNPQAFLVLKNRYAKYQNIRIIHDDTLLSDELTLFGRSGHLYDRIIANPPYGAWQSFEKRKLLKKHYSNFYVKETYGLFLVRCIQLLKEGGILVFLTPATFLNLNMHQPLRNFLLKNTKIREISLFPSHFFSGLNFGYAHLAITILEKCSDERACQNHSFRLLSDFKQASELGFAGKALALNQSQVLNNVNQALFAANKQIADLLNSAVTKLGELAKCVTGFYSGDDKLHLRPISPNVKNSKNSTVVSSDLICADYKFLPNLLKGIESPACFIPIVKGGGCKYYKAISWYIDWSREAVKHYQSAKKARFQNSAYYFQNGIAVPMVSSSQLSATLLEATLFDQSIVGVFPNDEHLLYYLLAFLNTPTCNKLIRTLNPSANNSANYLKRLPILLPSETNMVTVNNNVKQIISLLKTGQSFAKDLELELHAIIQDLYGF